MLICSSEFAVEFTTGSPTDVLYLIESETLCPTLQKRHEQPN